MSDEKAELSGWKIIREMLKHIWPRDRPGLKARVIVALGLLVGAKVLMQQFLNALLNGTSHPAPTSGIEYPSSILLQVCC